MTEHKNLIPTESQSLIDITLQFCESVIEVTISNDAEYKRATELTKEVQGYTKQIDTERKSLLQPFKEATDFINDTFRVPQKALENLKSKLRNSIGVYTQMLERKRLEAQRKAGEIARKERERLAAEAKAKEEKAAKLAQEGKTAEARKQAEQAQTLQDKAEKTEAKAIETTTPEIKGMHTRVKYSGEIVDKRAFIEYALSCDQSTVMLECIHVDMSPINKMIQSTKGKIVLPGIKIEVEKIPVFR